MNKTFNFEASSLHASPASNSGGWKAISSNEMLSNTTILQFHSPNPSHNEKSRWQSEKLFFLFLLSRVGERWGGGGEDEEIRTNAPRLVCTLDVVYAAFPSSIVWSKLSGLYFSRSDISPPARTSRGKFCLWRHQIKEDQKVNPFDFAFASLSRAPLSHSRIHTRQSDPIRHNLSSIKGHK